MSFVHICHSLPSKTTFQENFVLLTEKTKFHFSTNLYSRETIVIHLVKVTIKYFKGSLMSYETCIMHKTLLPVTNLCTLSVFITSFVHLDNSHL